MNPKKQEYIGKPITVSHSPNNTITGVKGTVRDETKNTFLIQTQNTFKIIPKQQNTFTIAQNVIQGNTITQRPHQRITLKS